MPPARAQPFAALDAGGAAREPPLADSTFLYLLARPGARMPRLFLATALMDNYPIQAFATQRHLRGGAQAMARDGAIGFTGAPTPPTGVNERVRATAQVTRASNTQVRGRHHREGPDAAMHGGVASQFGRCTRRRRVKAALAAQVAPLVDARLERAAVDAVGGTRLADVAFVAPREPRATPGACSTEKKPESQCRPPIERLDRRPCRRRSMRCVCGSRGRALQEEWGTSHATPRRGDGAATTMSSSACTSIGT